MALINPTSSTTSASSVGTNGQVAPNTSTLVGFNNNQAGTQQTSQSTPLPTQDQAIANAQTTDGSLSVSIAGDPSGDFAGVNILEQVITDGTGLFVNTRVQNPVKTDVNNATVPSDAIGATVAAKIGDFTLIDTTGYQSIVISTITYTGTPTYSNDLVNFVQVTGSQSNNSVLVVNIAANVTHVFPCTGRYFRLQCLTAGSFTYYLRQTPFNFISLQGGQQPINVSQIGAAAIVTGGVAGSLAVGSASSVGAAPTSNPLLAGGVDSGGLTRRLLTDTTGILQTNSTSPSINQYFGSAIYPEQFLPLRVEQIHTTRGQDSLQDLLAQILVELKTLNYYTREIPNSINLMLQQSSLAGFMPASMQDEQEQFFSDSTLFNLTKGQ